MNTSPFQFQPEAGNLLDKWVGVCPTNRMITKRERDALKSKRWRERHPERAKEVSDRSRAKNRERILERQRAAYHADPEKQRAWCRRWQNKNPGYSTAKHKEYRQKYPERYKEYESRRVRPPGQRNASLRKWCAMKRATDPNWKLRQNLRTRLYFALKGLVKVASVTKLLGCSIENLWIHLESQFEEGMCRENYGSIWEVDHIIACALFDLTKPEHQKRCFHFSNLQPLFIIENRSKGAKHEVKTI